MRPRPALAALAPALALAAVSVAHAQAPHVNFVTCPLFRDAADQCWLAEYNGKTYYIGRVGQEQAPELLHRALVQGVVKAGEMSCGGIVIEPVTISVLPEVDYACNTVLPDNGDRPSEPSTFGLPLDIQLRIGAPQPDPAGPFETRAWNIRFGHDDLFLNQVAQRDVEQAFRYARAGGAVSIALHGRAVDSRLDNGDIMKERPGLARQRAEDVRDALIGLGWPSGRLSTRWDEASAAGDGETDAVRRGVTVEVVFDAASARGAPRP